MKHLGVYGRKRIKELICDEITKGLIEKIYLNTSQKELIDLCEKNSIEFEIKSKSWFFTKIKKNKYKDGIAYLKEQNQMNLDEALEMVSKKDEAVFLILDKVQDPQNFGAILRTCFAGFVDGVIYSKKNSSPINCVTLNASRGYAVKLPLVVVSNINDAIEKLKSNGFWIYATTLSNQSKSIHDIEYTKKLAMIFGNEGHGISDLTMQKADFHIKIPMNEKVDSLNVAVCAGICIFDYLRKKENKKNLDSITKNK